MNGKCALFGDIYVTTKKPMSYHFMSRHVICHDYRDIPTTKQNSVIFHRNIMLCRTLSGHGHWVSGVHVVVTGSCELLSGEHTVS